MVLWIAKTVSKKENMRYNSRNAVKRDFGESKWDFGHSKPILLADFSKPDFWK